MSTGDYAEGARSGQDEIIATIVNSFTQLMGATAPAIMPGVLYTRSQVERNLGISPDTVTLWLDNGLPSFRPGTRSDMIMGSDVIDFVRNNRTLTRPASYKEKIEQRKRGRKK